MANYAVIKKGSIEVLNTIIADDDFEIDGQYLIKISSDTFCQSGMYYNKDDGKFYFDSELTQDVLVPEETINP